jgi:hypothetical protein
VIDTAGAGIQQGRAARAQRARERACVKWDGEASAGAGGAQKELRLPQQTWGSHRSGRDFVFPNRPLADFTRQP